MGGYSAVRYDGAAKAGICTNYTAGKAASADYSCNPDFNVSQLGVLTRWTPVSGLTFSGEVQWFHLDQKFAGSAVLSPSAPKPATRYQFADQDTFLLEVRAQRNFYIAELRPLQAGRNHPTDPLALPAGAFLSVEDAQSIACSEKLTKTNRNYC